MEYSGISELFQVVYSSAIALHMLSGKAYVRALPASYTVYFGTYYFSIHLPLSLIEQLSTTMLKRKYLCYTGNSNDKQFPGEISKHVDANDIEELCTPVEQIGQDKDTTLTSEASKKFCRVIAR